MTNSTPDALWGSPALRALRPTAVTCSDLGLGRLLRRCSLAVPVGTRLLVVSEPDGAAASALVRVLAGLARPRRGRISIAGLTDASAEGWGRRVAYVGPEPGIHRWMTPREALELAARLLELAPADAARRLERALSWVRISDSAADRPMRRGGPPLLQRTGLAAALMADPEVLLLDQPLRAIEAEERTEILRLPGRRRTLLLASRYPASEERLVGHVCLLRDGRVALVAPVSDLEAAGLTLSMSGILDLADARSGDGSAARQRQTVAAAR